MTDLCIPKAAQELDFELPSVRQLTLELLQLLNAPDVAMSDVVEMIRLDPVLTGRIIAYANSPLMMSAHPVTKLDTAVIRTGLAELKRIVYRTVLRDAFATQAGTVAENIMQAIWVHGLAASLAMDKLRVLLRGELRLRDDEEAFLSALGILHNAGFLLLQHNFPEPFSDLFLMNPPQSMDDLLERERIAFHGLDHCLAGKYVLDRWYFPDFIGNSVLTYCDTPPAGSDLVRLLRLSTHLALQSGFSVYPDHPTDFWLQGLPESWDLEPALALVPELAHDVAILHGILDM